MKFLLVPPRWLKVHMPFSVLGAGYRQFTTGSFNVRPLLLPPVLSRIIQTGETPKLVTWEWANFLCPCIEMYRDRRKKKYNREVYTFNLAKIWRPGKCQCCGTEPRAKTLQPGLPMRAAALPAPLSRGGRRKGNARSTAGVPAAPSFGCANKPRLWGDDVFFCLLFVPSPPSLPKTTS